METESAKNLNYIDLDTPDPFMQVESFQMELVGDNPSQHPAWMIHDHFKCQVVGTCLSLEEQKKLLKKTGKSIKNYSTYEIHGILVNCLSDNNKLSKRIDAYLNRKFKQEISEFFNQEKSLFLDAWKTHFKKGEVEGLLWVGATRTDLSEEDISLIFGDIHMQMHLNAAHNMKLLQKLSYQQKENQKLSQKIQDTAGIRRAIKKEQAGLEKEHEKLRRKYDVLDKAKLEIEKELSELRNRTGMTDLEAKNRRSQAELIKLSEEIKIYRRHVKTLEDKNSKLCSRLDREHEINTYFREDIKNVITKISTLNQCDETCPSFDLCKKRILIVGGIDRMQSLYRDLIEKSGGIFECHNGHMKGGSRTLENRIKRADVVLCPVNINSHNACLTVKKLGKKYSRHVQMLAGSGLNAISQAILDYHKGISA